MTGQHAEDWHDWDAERKRFKRRDTQGLDADVEALRQHIAKLWEVAPKDKAGLPVGIAWRVIHNLREDLSRIEQYLRRL